MNIAQRSPRRTERLFQSLAVSTVLLAFGVTACSSNDPASNAGGQTSTTANAKLASAALNAGLKSYADGNLAAASVSYQKTLKYDPTNKYAFYNLALIDEAAGNYGLAETKYRSAIKSDPAYEPALFNLAILRTARNDPKEAIELYQRAVAADKKDAAAWLNLGLLLRANGEKRAGNRDVLKAIGLDPKLTDPAESASPAGSSGS
jgi:tetratricopeptide (TPR) repeat protein